MHEWNEITLFCSTVTVGTLSPCHQDKEGEMSDTVVMKQDGRLAH